MKKLWLWLRAWWYFTTHVTHAKQMISDGFAYHKEKMELFHRLNAVQESHREAIHQLDMCLRAFGQMKHVDGHPGIMSITVEKRGALITSGYAAFDKGRKLL